MCSRPYSVTSTAAVHHYKPIGSICHLLTDKAAICLVNALITSRLDFCNSTLAGSNVDQVNRLQRLQNAAARLVTKKRKHDHISSVLFDLHRLPVSYRIKFKLCVLVYRHFEETLPPYLSSVLKHITRSIAYVHPLTDFL